MLSTCKDTAIASPCMIKEASWSPFCHIELKGLENDTVYRFPMLVKGLTSIQNILFNFNAFHRGINAPQGLFLQEKRVESIVSTTRHKHRTFESVRHGDGTS